MTGVLGKLSPFSTPADTQTAGHPSTADRTRPAATPVGFVSPILHFVAVVPLSIWLALGGAVALAAAAGAAAVRSGFLVRRQAGQFAALNEAAMTDALTGILNRRGFIAAADRELARSRRYERPFVLAYVDVRGLKAVNDSEGHRAGDKLIQTAAQLLADCARADDVVGRLGGDEMALVLAEQGREGAVAATDRISAEVAIRRAALGLQSRWDLTVGTAAYPQDGETIDELLRVADARLYEQRGIEIRDGVPAGIPARR
jgi:diguanylate cyclase (GGDEF)-like protein